MTTITDILSSITQRHMKKNENGTYGPGQKPGQTEDGDDKKSSETEGDDGKDESDQDGDDQNKPGETEGTDEKPGESEGNDGEEESGKTEEGGNKPGESEGGTVEQPGKTEDGEIRQPGEHKTPIGVTICACGHIMPVYVYDESKADKAVAIAHTKWHIANGGKSN